MSGWNRFIEVVKVLGLVSVLLILAGSGAEITMLLQARVSLCLQTLVPSLFGCMVISNILQKSGAALQIGKLIPVRTFRKNPQIGGVFVLSQIAGYPVGVSLLRRLADENVLCQEDAGRLGVVCFGCGPAFAVGLIGAQVFGSAKIGWLLMFCTIAANVCILLMLPPIHMKNTENIVSSYDSVPKILVDSVADTMRGLFGICGIVLMFGVVTWLLEKFGFMLMIGKIMQLSGFSSIRFRCFLTAFLDITQLPVFCRCGLSAKMAIPISAFLLAFGGVCALLQCIALGVECLSFRKLFFIRILAGILAAVFAYIFIPIVLKNDVVSAFSTVPKVSRTGSPLVGALIFFIGFPILLKKD